MKKVFNLILFLLFATTAYSAEQPAHIGSFKLIYGQGDKLLYWDDTNYRIYYPTLSGLSLSSGTLSLSTTGVGAGTYRSVTVGTDGRVTAGTNPTTFAGYAISDTSANLDTSITDDTGSGALVFATSPTFVTSALSPNFSSTNADPSDVGIFRLGNAETIGWEASPAGTDVTITVNTSEQIVGSTSFVGTTSVLAPFFSQNSGDPADAGNYRLPNAGIIGWEASPAGTDVTLTANTSEVIVASTSVQATTSLISPVFVTTNADPADAAEFRLGNAERLAWEASPAGTDLTVGFNASNVFNASAPIDATTGYRIGNVAATGTILRGNGTNFVASTATYPDTVTSGRVLIATGTNTIGEDSDINFSGSTLTVTDIVGSTSIKSTNTGDIGWSIVTGANTACNTTCTNACVLGQDTDAAPYPIVNCADATADRCSCAGAN